jgi:electron transfer flavoprotein alpha/beta subunit
MNDKYYLVWASVPNAKEYIIYRADQAVQNTQQMSVVGKTTETMFEYPFDPYADTDKWARYAVEAVCIDNAQKQVGDMTAVKVGPEKTILVMVMLLIIGFAGWRMVKTY